MSLNGLWKKSFKKKSKTKGNNSLQIHNTTTNSDDITEENVTNRSLNQSTFNIEFDLAGPSLSDNSSAVHHLSSSKSNLTKNPVSSEDKINVASTSQSQDQNSINVKDSAYSSLENKKSKHRHSFFKKIKNSFATKDKTRESIVPSSPFLAELNTNEKGVVHTSTISKVSDEDETSALTITLQFENLESELHIESDVEAIQCDEQIYPTESNISTTEDIDFNKKKKTEDVSDDEIWKFLGQPDRDVVLIGKVLAILGNNDVRSLYKELGYDKTIIYYIILKNVLCGNVFVEIENLLSTYKNINERRLQDVEFYFSISNKSSEILKVKKHFNSIFKTRTENNLKCMKCKEECVSILFLPCGHVILCGKCSNIHRDVCECCGSNIEERHQIFL